MNENLLQVTLTKVTLPAHTATHATHTHVQLNRPQAATKPKYKRYHRGQHAHDPATQQALRMLKEIRDRGIHEQVLTGEAWDDEELLTEEEKAMAEALKRYRDEL